MWEKSLFTFSPTFSLPHICSPSLSSPNNDFLLINRPTSFGAFNAPDVWAYRPILKRLVANYKLAKSNNCCTKFLKEHKCLIFVDRYPKDIARFTSMQPQPSSQAYLLGGNWGYRKINRSTRRLSYENCQLDSSDIKEPSKFMRSSRPLQPKGG